MTSDDGSNLPVVKSRNREASVEMPGVEIVELELCGKVKFSCSVVKLSDNDLSIR